jgi:peroxiredoxin
MANTLKTMSNRRTLIRVGALAIGLAVGVTVGLVLSRDDDTPVAVDDTVTLSRDEEGGAGADGGDSAAVVTFPDDALGNTDIQGDPMPIVEISNRDGAVFSTAELLGQPLVLNFWFAACPPCAKELPDFAEVHAEVGDEVRFVGINTLDSIEEMERFAGERGVRYELYRDDFAAFTDAIGAAAFPVTLFVTSNGMIVDQAGVLDADGLRDRVDALLAVEASLS